MVVEEEISTAGEMLDEFAAAGAAGGNTVALALGSGESFGGHMGSGPVANVKKRRKKSRKAK